MSKKIKLKRILQAMNGERIDFSVFDSAVANMRKELEQKVAVATLDEVNIELMKFKKKLDLQPLLDAVDSIRQSFDDKTKELSTLILVKSKELKNSVSNEAVNLELSDLKTQLSTLEEVRKIDLQKVQDEIKDMQTVEDRMDESFIELSTRLYTLEELDSTETFNAEINKLRVEFLSKLANVGGGSMNRKMTFGGTDYLTKYTDINYKAGANVTFTVVSNDTTKMVDVTIAATGSSGLVRSISSISSPTTAGATVGTDYVYLVSGTTTLTLPTAVSNTNLYTVKNVGTGVVTIATTSSQTIDGATTITMPVQYTSVDLISDTTSWHVT